MAVNKHLLNLIDRTEGGGSYNTLYGNRQRRKGSQFEGTDVSQMTVGQVMDFTRPDGAYGQSVKNEIGRVATPTGRYQIVGTTLRSAASDLGIDPSTPYNSETQDRIANHLASQRLASADTEAGKMAALRQEWEGLRHVPDDQLRAAINGQGDIAPATPSTPTTTTQIPAATTAPPDTNIDPRMLDKNGKEITGLAGFGRGIRNGIDDALGVKTTEDGTRQLWGFNLDGEDSIGKGLGGFAAALASAEKAPTIAPLQGGRTGGSAPVQLEFSESLVNTNDDDPRKRRGGMAGFGGFTRRA